MAVMRRSAHTSTGVLDDGGCAGRPFHSVRVCSFGYSAGASYALKCTLRVPCLTWVETVPQGVSAAASPGVNGAVWIFRTL